MEEYYCEFEILSTLQDVGAFLLPSRILEFKVVSSNSEVSDVFILLSSEATEEPRAPSLSDESTVGNLNVLWIIIFKQLVNMGFWGVF